MRPEGFQSVATSSSSQQTAFSKLTVALARFPRHPKNPTRHTLGEPGQISLDHARQKARDWLGLIQKGIVNQLSKRILAGDVDRTAPVLVDVFDGVVVFRNEAPALERTDGNRK